MGNINAVPVVSQVKSGVLAATGDVERARQIQHEFIHECPGVAQATAFVYWKNGDADKCWETNKRSKEALLAMVDCVPVVGHAKGAIHYYLGQEDECRHAVVAATRAAGVISGGVVGGMTMLPAAAVALGILGGTAVDAIVTVMEARPAGVFEAVETVKKDPSVENCFNATAGVVMDGICGGMAGTGAVEYGNPQTTRTAWRGWMRKNARAKITGAAPPPVPAATPTWAFSRIISPRNNPAIVVQGCAERINEEPKQKKQQGYLSYFWSNKEKSKL